MLCDKPEMFRPVDGLNGLRNSLVHSGQTQIPLPGQVLLLIDAIKFVDAYVQSEFGQKPDDFFAAPTWQAALKILGSADPDIERRYQAKLQAHRALYKALDQKSLRLRRSTGVDVDTPTVVLQCPACSEEALAYVEDETTYDRKNHPHRYLQVTHIECPVCELKLDDGELERFQYLVETYLERLDEESEYDLFVRRVTDADT